MPRVEIHPEAQAEVNATIAWYENEWIGLGMEFLDEVDRSILLISETPDIWRNYGEIPCVRRLNIHRFPYHIVYRQSNSISQIVAINWGNDFSRTGDSGNILFR